MLSKLKLSGCLRGSGSQMKRMLPGRTRKHVAAELRLLRKIRSLTQAELAAYISIVKTQVSNVESGSETITLHTVDKFPTALLGPLPQRGAWTLEQRVGIRIRNARRARGLTQAELAAKAGTTVRYVQRVERAEVPTTLDQLEPLALVLKFNASQLLDGIVMRRSIGKPLPRYWMRRMLETWSDSAGD